MKKIFKGIFPIMCLLVIWSIISQYTNSLFLPKPIDVVNTANSLFENGVMINSIIDSSIRVFLSTIISCIISIPLALLMFYFKFLDEFITPIITIFRYFPGNAFYPLLILWVGINDSMKITFLFLVTFVYFLPTIVLCIKNVDVRLIETSYTMGMTKFQIVYKVVLPYCLPSICKNITMMLGMGWTYIPIAEMANSTSGLGYLINIGSARGRTDMVFVAILLIMIISFIIDNICNYLIKILFPWYFKIVIEE